MMIGDWGMGVGSRIKRHSRYGGTWKQDVHAHYTNVCITNENNASQTRNFNILSNYSESRE
ncbi:uncharacterized protein B0P05DRAFT_474001 [Gilbertella persicaria]|uniref:uncharacterized protein n=1 Tax=Gilbertella persicaria TaxID=101096 RepID=UPI0022204AEB|nr:uncharacterized protein B0P05DRAFT_474001 [Gilbertella persicaria]KAI8071170.1 hypothetical protein B0P05DRAFT_474001 [Gilbertella persicaria]